MIEITRAKPGQAEEILRVTKKAFEIYREALLSQKEVRLTALLETEADVVRDIKRNTVFCAVDGSRIVGAVRIEALSPDLAYIYRFAVEPSESNGGVGSELLDAAISFCAEKGFSAIALHTNSKYYKLARYYYGKGFYVHSTGFDKGYIRALFVKELGGGQADLAPALAK